MLKDVQLGVESVAVVEIFAVNAFPKERPAASHALDIIDGGSACGQYLHLRLAKVLAYGPDDANVIEERGCEREMGSGSAQHPPPPTRGRCHRIECNRA